MYILRNFISSVFAGIMIGIGGTVYLSYYHENKVVAALLFCVGLLSVFIFDFCLYTGRVGYLACQKPKEIPKYFGFCIVVWFGNLLGVLITGLAVNYSNPVIGVRAAEAYQAKVSQTPLQAVILGVLCGVLMYIAVDNFKNNSSAVGKYVVVFVCIPAFILAGFEHSIADMFYFAASNGVPLLSAKGIVYILYVSLGNWLGAVLIPLGRKIIDHTSERLSY